MTTTDAIVPRPAATDTAAPRAPYQTPALKELGDLRSITLGGSPGTGDSGGSFGFSKYPGT